MFVTQSLLCSCVDIRYMDFKLELTDDHNVMVTKMWPSDKVVCKRSILLILILDSPEAKLHRDILACWVANDLLRPVTGEESESVGKSVA